MDSTTRVFSRSRRALRVTTAVLAATLLAACGSSSLDSTTVPPPPPPPRVAILSVDGLRPDGLLQANAVHIPALAARGAYTWRALTILPPITLPAHASMLSGYTPAVHGCTWNDYRPERGTISVPTVFSVAHTAGLRTVMVVGKEKLAHLNAAGSVDTYVLATRGDDDVANEAVVQAQTGFGLMFVHFPDTDLTGHASGWMSSAYLAQIARTDQAVGRVLAALPPNTTVIVSADHGGHGQTHGSDIPSDVTIPWIVAGPKVAANRVINQAVRTMDTAATAAYVLGLALPADVAGRPVYEAFVSP